MKKLIDRAKILLKKEADGVQESKQAQEELVKLWKQLDIPNNPMFTTEMAYFSAQRRKKK